jgi:hypothetical protein
MENENGQGKGKGYERAFTTEKKGYLLVKEQRQEKSF